MQAPGPAPDPYKAPREDAAEAPPESAIVAGLALVAFELFASLIVGGAIACVAGPVVSVLLSCAAGAFLWGWYYASTRLSRPLVVVVTHWFVGVAVVVGAFLLGESEVRAAVMALTLLVVAVPSAEWGARRGPESVRRRKPDPSAPTLRPDDPLQQLMGGNQPLPVVPDPDPYEPGGDDPHVIVIEPPRPPDEP